MKFIRKFRKPKFALLNTRSPNVYNMDNGIWPGLQHTLVGDIFFVNVIGIGILFEWEAQSDARYIEDKRRSWRWRTRMQSRSIFNPPLTLAEALPEFGNPWRHYALKLTDQQARAIRKAHLDKVIRLLPRK